NIEWAEEDVRHTGVVVLAGMHERLADRMASERGDDAGHLHEIRTCADDVENVHHALCFATGRWFDRARILWTARAQSTLIRVQAKCRIRSSLQAHSASHGTRTCGNRSKRTERALEEGLHQIEAGARQVV